MRPARMSGHAASGPDDRLHESEERFRRLVNSIDDIVYTLDTQQRHTAVYGKWAREGGLTPEFFLGKTARDIFGASGAQVHEENNARALAGESLRYDWSLRQASGEIYFQTSISPLRATDGAIVGLVGVGRDVTAVRNAVERLRQYEVRFVRAFQTNPIPSVIVRVADRAITDVNPAFLRLFEYTREEVIGQTPLSLGIYDSLEEQWSLMRMQDEAGQIVDYELALRTKSRRLLYIRLSVDALTLDGEEHVIGRFVDVSDRRDAEIRLRASEARWRTALELVGDGTWEWDVNASRVRVSEGWRTLLGFDDDERASKPDEWKARVHPEDRERFFAKFRAHMAGETPSFRTEYRTRQTDGAWRWVFSRGVVTERGEGGEPLYMVGTVSDITELKQNEGALRTLQQAVEQSAASVIITDSRWVIEYVNPRFEEETGFAREEAVGRTPQILRIIVMPRASLAALLKALRAHNEWRGELCVRAKSGQIYWKMASIGPVIDAEGQITHYVAVQEDITERKRMEAEIQQKAAHAAALLQEVNHRVKNNLQAIRGLLFAELRALPAESRPAVALAFERTSHRISSLAEAHAMLSQSQWEPVPLSALALRVLSVARSALRPEQEAIIDIPKAGVVVSPRQVNSLAIVIYELSSNTFKYALGDRRRVVIAARIEAEGGEIRLTYRDDGPGYPEEVLEGRGHDVGLYLIYRLVEHTLQGSVALSNDGGSVTTLRFPAEEGTRT